VNQISGPSSALIVCMVIHTCTGLPVPPLGPADHNTKQPLVCVEGTSLKPLLQDPNRYQKFKKAAFSQYP